MRQHTRRLTSAAASMAACLLVFGSCVEGNENAILLAGAPQDALRVAIAACVESGDEKAWRQACKQAIDHDVLAHRNRWPSREEFYERVAHVLWDSGYAAKALEVYREAVARFPRNATFQFGLGEALVNRHDASDEAAAAYQRAVNLNPNFVDAYAGLGDVQVELGRNEEGLVSYRKALGLNATNRRARVGYAYVLSRLEQRDESIAAWRRLIADYTDDVIYPLLLADVLLDAGQGNDALAVLTKLAKQEGAASQLTLCRLARAWRMTGRLKEAADACDTLKYPVYGNEACACLR